MALVYSSTPEVSGSHHARAVLLGTIEVVATKPATFFLDAVCRKSGSVDTPTPLFPTTFSVVQRQRDQISHRPVLSVSKEQ